MSNSKNNNDKSGWERRCILDNFRITEQVEMYESIGFEVMVKDVDPNNLPEEYCRTCFISNPEKYKILYTRKEKTE
jgi:hypothetical protein